MEVTIGIDLGGSRIKVAVRNPDGVLSHLIEAPAHDQDDQEWKRLILSSVRAVQAEYKDHPLVIGIAAPGLPNESGTAIAYMPGRMEGLENFEWKDFLGYPTFVVNDAVAALMAESRAGAAVNKKNVVLVTLGTGVGGAILIEGQPYSGAFGKAGHIGHMVINDQGIPGITGMPGSLEESIGNCTIRKRSNQVFSSTEALVEAYRKGDPFAGEVWLTSVRKLAIGLASLINILSPEMIVLGGGITEAGVDLFGPLETYLKEYEWTPGGQKVTIRKAQMGDRAGAVGALFFALEKNNLNKN